MDQIVKDFLNHINNFSPWIIYTVFFVSAVLQLTFPPYPGDTVLIAGGYLGSLGIGGGDVPIFLSYWTGTLVSSFILYELGQWKGEDILKNKIVKKYFNNGSQVRAKGWVHRYGIVAFLLCKFIPGLNSLIIFFGGVFRYNKILFYIAVGIASTIHNIAFFMVGRVIGDNYDKIIGFLYLYNKMVLILIGVFAAAYLGYRLIKSRVRKVL